MTLSLADQYSQVTVQKDLQSKVTAASFTAALAAFNAAPLSDTVKQQQRMTLANACVKNPAYAWQTFAWFVVSRPALTAVTDLTDVFVQTTVTAAFDSVSQQVIPVPPIP